MRKLLLSMMIICATVCFVNSAWAVKFSTVDEDTTFHTKVAASMDNHQIKVANRFEEDKIKVHGKFEEKKHMIKVQKLDKDKLKIKY